MKIACNLSTELMALIDTNRVKVDYVKIALASREDKIPLAYSDYGKLLLHGVGLEIPQHTGAKIIKDNDWDQINQHLRVCRSEYLGVHFGTYKDDWEDDIVTYEMIKARMSLFISLWKENICCKLLVENLPYTDYYHLNSPGILKESVNPRLISEVCEEHDIDMILDIAHAKIAASGLQMTIEDYLNQLPLHRIREIHIVGTQSTDTGLRDKHAEMTQEDYDLLSHVLSISQPKVVTLEYGGFGDQFADRSDINAIERQIIEIRRIISA